jgi:hypothetical protein
MPQNTHQEKWLPVVGYENRYLISDCGSIFSLKANKIKMQRYSPHYEYRVTSLYKNGKNNGVFVHRMVAEAFIPNPCGKPQVNHKDGNKLNNKLSNLEWVTASENIQHSVDTGLRPRKPYNENRHRSKDLRNIRLSSSIYEMSA